MASVNRSLQRLFNIKPTATSKPVVDKYGRKNWFEWFDDEAPILLCCYRGKRIGEARLVWADTTLMIGNIEIKLEHRKRGIGSALLEEVVAYARVKRAKRMTGFIVEKDAAENPSLFDWYRRHSFQVICERQDDRVALIHLDLIS